MKQLLLMLVFSLMISCSKEEVKCPCIVAGIDKGLEIRTKSDLLISYKRYGSVILLDKSNRIITLVEPDPIALSIIHSRQVGDTLK